MRLPRIRVRIFKDEQAQALAEFVIVVPLIIFVFMLMIQYLLMVQTSQLCNYAAYVASRVYAVRCSIDADDARERAIDAAAIALAPVSKLAPGEVGLPIGDLSSFFPSVVPGVIGNVADLAEGYAVARYIRLNEYVAGGSVNICSSGVPTEIHIEINYAEPLLIPGLPELWRIIGGERDIFDDVKPLQKGLGNIAALGFLGQYPYVNVRGKCAMGREDWGSDEEHYRPRERQTVDSEEASNPELEAKAKEQKEAKDELKDAQARMLKEAQHLKEAQAAVDHVQKDYDAVMSDPNSTQGQKDSAAEDLHKAKLKRDKAESDYEDAKNEYDRKKQKLEDLTGVSYG